MPEPSFSSYKAWKTLQVSSLMVWWRSGCDESSTDVVVELLLLMLRPTRQAWTFIASWGLHTRICFANMRRMASSCVSMRIVLCFHFRRNVLREEWCLFSFNCCFFRLFVFYRVVWGLSLIRGNKFAQNPFAKVICSRSVHFNFLRALWIILCWPSCCGLIDDPSY